MPRTLLVTCLAGLACCAAPARNLPLGAEETVCETGGELSVAALPPGNVEHLDGALAIWGLTEVPDGSRMQAAQAMVDAITRSELIKRVQISVADSSLDLADTERQTIERRTVETLMARLPGLAPIAHGWERLERDGQRVLRLAGRLQIRRANLAPMVFEAFGANQRAAAEALLDRLFATPAGE